MEEFREPRSSDEIVERLRREARDARTALLCYRDAARRKDEFLSAVSHEFRTPLTSIRSFAEILLSSYGVDRDPETTREFLSIIHQESVRLGRLVENLLDLGRLQAGRMEWDFRPHDLGEVFTRATRSMEALAREKDIEIVVDPGEPAPVLVLDRDKVIQVLVNLLANAVKYAPEESAVTLTATVEEDGDARIVVRDHGPGVPEEFRTVAFDRFRQVGSAEERQPGSGLGLSISRAIVRAHGGRIWLDEPEGQGCEVVFVLPPVPPDDETDEGGDHAASEDAAPPGRSILVIDDDANFRRFLARRLSRDGLAVVEAADGAQGIVAARASLPGLVVLDADLPGLTAVDVLAVMRSDPELADIPVLAVSVGSDSYLPGARRHLEKPIDAAELIQTVRWILDPDTTTVERAEVPAGT